MNNIVYRNLFTRANYVFSTKDEGRQSTLYFQDAHGNQGRYRRSHDQGTQVSFHGVARRLFIRNKHIDIDEFLKGNQLDGNMLEKAQDLYNMTVARGGHANFSLQPQNGFTVLEFSVAAQMGHGSSGKVLLHDPEATDAVFAELAGMDDSKVKSWI